MQHNIQVYQDILSMTLGFSLFLFILFELINFIFNYFGLTEMHGDLLAPD